MHKLGVKKAAEGLPARTTQGKGINDSSATSVPTLHCCYCLILEESSQAPREAQLPAPSHTASQGQSRVAGATSSGSTHCSFSLLTFQLRCCCLNATAPPRPLTLALSLKQSSYMLYFSNASLFFVWKL